MTKPKYRLNLKLMSPLNVSSFSSSGKSSASRTESNFWRCSANLNRAAPADRLLMRGRYILGRSDIQGAAGIDSADVADSSLIESLNTPLI